MTPVILMSDKNPYDNGVVVNEAGYSMSLGAWREHITRNLAAGGHTLESVYREYPKTMRAMERSNLLFLHENLERMCKANPANAAALHELFESLKDGATVEIKEAFPMQQPAAAAPMQAQPPMPPQQPPMQQQANPDEAGDMHTHQVQCDEQGNGTTDAGADGHAHAIRGNQVLAQNGHTHDFQQMKNQPPPMMQQAAPQPPPQGGN